jgi:hypothetical protein
VFPGEISQCSLHSGAVEIVLNDHEITPQRGQQFLDGLIEILGSERWGASLPRRKGDDRSEPPAVYANIYNFSIPYDSRNMSDF